MTRASHLGAWPLGCLDGNGGGMDGCRNGVTQSSSGQADASTDDSQDQRVFGRRGARLVTNKRSNKIAHVKNPIVAVQELHPPPSKKTDAKLGTHHASSGSN